jgi:uncharacterized membrane protein YbhN (UPF0104 family)
VATARKILGNRWVRYALTLALLALVIWKADPSRLANALAVANPGYLLLALALTLPFLALKSLRWHLMLAEAGVEATFNEALLSLVGGMGLALITPARLGELVRAAYLRDGQKVKIGGLVMIDKGFDVVVLAGLSIPGAWALLSHASGVALAAIALAGLAAVYQPSRLTGVMRILASRLPMRRKVDQILASTSCLSVRATSIYLALTLASFAVVLLQFAIILLDWHPWSLDIVILTFPLVVLTNVLPVTIGGLGIREGAAALLLGTYGISPAHAAIAAFLMFFINTALPGLAGALLTPALALNRARTVHSLDRP